MVLMNPSLIHFHCSDSAAEQHVYNDVESSTALPVVNGTQYDYVGKAIPVLQTKAQDTSGDMETTLSNGEYEEVQTNGVLAETKVTKNQTKDEDKKSAKAKKKKKDAKDKKADDIEHLTIDNHTDDQKTVKHGGTEEDVVYTLPNKFRKKDESSPQQTADHQHESDDVPTVEGKDKDTGADTPQKGKKPQIAASKPSKQMHYQLVSKPLTPLFCQF